MNYDDRERKRICAGGECALTCLVYNLGGICLTPTEVAKYWANRKRLLADLDAIVY